MATNLLSNSRFYGNFDEWITAGTVAIDRARGYPRNGCAKLSAGATLTQDEGVSGDALYTVYYFFRLDSGATLTAGYADGGTTWLNTHSTEAKGPWYEGIITFAPDASLGGGVQFAASGGAAWVDALALVHMSLPITRRRMAILLEERLGQLAAEACWSRQANSAGPDGDYSTAIDEALRALGACDTLGEPDIVRLQPEQINDALEAAQRNLLQRLRADYALSTDVSLGPRRESRSQIAGLIDGMIGGGGGGGGDRRVAQAGMNYADWRR